jgi:hypothetical protein
MDAVEEHQVTRDFLPGGCDAGEFSLVNAMKGSTECYDVAFGDDLMRDQLIAREGCFSLADVFPQGGVAYILVDKVFGFRVGGHRVDVVFNELLVIDGYAGHGVLLGRDWQLLENLRLN